MPAAAHCRCSSCRGSRARSSRELAAALRAAEPPVVAVVRDDRTLLDCRTIADDEVEAVAAAVLACRTR